MTIEKIIKAVKEYIVLTIPEEAQNSWEKAELNFLIQPNRATLTGVYYLDGQDASLNMKVKSPELLVEQLELLHNVTTKGGINKWNKASFSLFPDNTLKYKLYWDEIEQQEIDNYQKEAEKNDPAYKASKWKWEQD